MEARVVGCEAELGFAIRGFDKQWTNVNASYMLNDVLQNHMPTTRHPREPSTRHYYENGMLIYVDVGDHPEVASAESADIKDVVASHVAGLALLHSGLKRAFEQKQRSLAYVLVNRVVSDEASWGFHENYLIDRAIAPGKGYGSLQSAQYLRSLAPFFAIRSQIAGSGSVYGDTYQLSQKAARVTHTFHNDTTRAKPLINMRDEPHADPEKYARLHIPSGDPTSPHILYRTLGLTSLAIRMAEQNKAPQLKVPYGVNWAVVARTVSSDITMTKSFMGQTALDVWDRYLGVMDKMVEQGVPDQEAEAFERAKSAYTDLRRIQAYAKEYRNESDHDRDAMVGIFILEHIAGTNQFDWAERLSYINKHADNASGADMDFDTVSKDGSMRYYWRRTQTQQSEACVSRERIRERLRTPPKGRATQRGRFIKRFGGLPGLRINWDKISYAALHTNERLNLELLEPAQEAEAFEPFCQQVSEAATREQQAAHAAETTCRSAS